MTYVAVGDSYAVGVGAGSSEDGCGRTSAGYPLAVARALEEPLRYEACQGATAREARERQTGAVRDDTTLVTVTVGGNDLDFAGVLTEVAKPAWLADSGPVLDRAEHRVDTELPEVLTTLYAALRAQAPDARVVVLGYPALFSGGDCSPVTFFSDAEIARMNGIADRLAEVMARVSRETDVEFVDVRDEFAGHGTCGEEEWIHGVAWPLEQSYHPNVSGHAAYARVALAALGRPEPIPADRPQPEVTRGGPPDRPHPVFTPPDLTSSESLDGAAAWGLDRDEVAELGRRVRPADPLAAPDLDAARRLHELHQRVRERRGWA